MNENFDNAVISKVPVSPMSPSRPTMPGLPPPQKFGFADALRGPAALCVVVSHLSVPLAPALFLNQLGQFGVAVFFLVSGFVIPISLTRYDTRAFLVARVLRIYPTYAVALTITLAALWLQGQPLSTDLLRYVSNYLIMAPVFGRAPFDDVVWTLQIELHFYVLCALIAPWIRKLSLAALAMPMMVFAAELIARRSGLPVAARLASGFPFLIFMCAGVSAFYFVNRKISAAAMVVYCLACFCLFLAAWWHIAGWTKMELSPVYAAAVCIFLAALVWKDRMAASGINGFFSRISYSLYVVHTGVGLWVLRLTLDAGPAYVAVVAASAAAVAAAVAVYVSVEAPSHRLGQRLAQIMTRRDRERHGGPAAAQRASGAPAMAPARWRNVTREDREPL